MKVAATNLLMPAKVSSYPALSDQRREVFQSGDKNQSKGNFRFLGYDSSEGTESPLYTQAGKKANGSYPGGNLVDIYI